MPVVTSEHILYEMYTSFLQIHKLDIRFGMYFCNAAVSVVQYGLVFKLCLSVRVCVRVCVRV